MGESEGAGFWRPGPPQEDPASTTVTIPSLQDEPKEPPRHRPLRPTHWLTPTTICALVLLALVVSTIGALIATSGGSGHRGSVQVSSTPQPRAAEADAAQFSSLWNEYLPVADDSAPPLASAEAGWVQQQKSADADASLAAQDSSGAGCSFIPTNPNPYMACRAQGEQNASSEQAAQAAAQAAANADVSQATTAAQSWIEAITTMLKGWASIHWVVAVAPQESTFYADASNLRTELQGVLAATTPSPGSPTETMPATSDEISQVTSDETALVTARTVLQDALHTASR